MMRSTSDIAASMSSMLEPDATRCTISICRFSRVDNLEADMLACGGSDASTVVESFDFATDEGSVSGSKSAFKTRASFAERVDFGAAIAMVEIWVLRRMIYGGS